MEEIKKFKKISDEELQNIDGGIGVAALVGYSLLAAGGTGTVGYFLARKFG